MTAKTGSSGRARPLVETHRSNGTLRRTLVVQVLVNDPETAQDEDKRHEVDAEVELWETSCTHCETGFLTDGKDMEAQRPAAEAAAQEGGAGAAWLAP